MIVTLPDSHLSQYHITMKQFVAILEMFLCKLYHDILIENVFQESDNLYYVYVRNLIMLLNLSEKSQSL